MILYALLRRLLGGSGWVGVALTYPPQLPWLAPGIVLGLLALAVRRRRAIAFNVLATIVVLFSVTGFTWHLGAAPRGRTIRVMTYNIAGGMRGGFHILNDVSAQQPDIAAFQESAPWGEHLDPIDALLTALPGYVVQRSPEVAVLSRFPITSWRAVPLPLREGRECLEVRVSTPAGPLTVITAHLSSVDVIHAAPGLDGAARLALLHDAQGHAVADLAMRASPPVLVLGDFNSTPQGPAYRHMIAFGVDAFGAAGRGFGYTYSADHPLVRIDYVFAGPGLRVLKAWTPHTHGSDHRPVVAEIALQARR